MTETSRLILSLRVAAKTGQYPLPPTEQPGYMFGGRPVVVDSLTLEDAAYQLEALSSRAPQAGGEGRDLIEFLATHFVVKDGPNKEASQYGHLELWWAARSVHEKPDAGTNPWMMLGDAGNSFSLAAMGQLQGLIEEANRRLAASPTPADEPKGDDHIVDANKMVGRDVMGCDAPKGEASHHLPDVRDAMKRDAIESGCRCQGCGNLYRVDFLVPDDLWKVIGPKQSGGGLLCGRCIVHRIEGLGQFGSFDLRTTPADAPKGLPAEALAKAGDVRSVTEEMVEAALEAHARYPTAYTMRDLMRNALKAALSTPSQDEGELRRALEEAEKWMRAEADQCLKAEDAYKARGEQSMADNMQGRAVGYAVSAAKVREALSRSNGETRGHAGHMAACKTAPVTRTGGPLDEVLSLARRVAFLHFHAEDRADNSQLLARECQRLYDALARFDGDNPDLTFCCGCREEIEIENGQEQWVLDGAKYHGGCYQQEVSAREALSRSPEGGEILTDFPDLTIRLRSVLEPEWIKPWCREAADCIESLTLEVERLKKALSQPPEGKE